MSDIPMSHLSSIEKLITFIILSFSITWSFWIPNVLKVRKNQTYSQLLHFLGGIGPISAALVLTYYDGGIELVTSLLFKVYASTSYFVLLASFLIPSLATFITYLLYLPPNSSPSLKVFIPGFVISMIFIPMEEIGWRGFMLSSLSELISPIYSFPKLILSACIIGFIWAIWHLPLFFISLPHLHPKNELPSAIFSYIFGLSVISLWENIVTIFTFSHSLLPAIISHSSLNASVGSVLGMNAGKFGYWFYYYSVVFMVLVTSTIYIHYHYFL